MTEDIDTIVARVEDDQKLGDVFYQNEIVAHDQYLLQSRGKFKLLDAPDAMMAGLNLPHRWDRVIYVGEVTRWQSQHLAELYKEKTWTVHDVLHDKLRRQLFGEI